MQNRAFFPFACNEIGERNKKTQNEGKSQNEMFKGKTETQYCIYTRECNAKAMCL